MCIPPRIICPENGDKRSLAEWCNRIVLPFPDVLTSRPENGDNWHCAIFAADFYSSQAANCASLPRVSSAPSFSTLQLHMGVLYCVSLSNAHGYPLVLVASKRTAQTQIKDPEAETHCGQEWVSFRACLFTLHMCRLLSYLGLTRV